MEAGQFDKNKVGCIIQARMSSTRLPGKVLLPLPFPDGTPLLGMIINQLTEIIHLQNIVVATSNQEENNLLIEYCKEIKVDYYRGSEENVLSRFTEIQQLYQFDQIVRLTADNPFIDTTILSEFLNWHIYNDNDYSGTEGLPLGMNMEVFRGSALIESLHFVQNTFDTEHVTPALKRENIFQKGYFKTGFNYTNSVRLTVDTAADFHTANTVLRLGYIKGLRGMDLVKDVLQNAKWLVKGNEQVIQKNRFSATRDEVGNAITILRQFEYFKAADYLEFGLEREEL